MRLLRVEGTEARGGTTLLVGTVEGEAITVGQTVAAVSFGGERDFGMLMMILPTAGPTSAGPREIDRGSPGGRVKVIFRRTQKTFPDEQIASLEKVERA